ncbi:hypothetical protein H7U19_04470 [Hyunsoonleella sp. SJ7]|uniref:Uncharacterized protein n=1 Tax=Hyunsoonleella aquatilis TaxID=2762758 RepID=A0A923KHZ9_9FLAO|nr:hypothetical protein [Hyunsoonleella aquatilis]MBC3757644.1 hypothetical protein [Hyunsoonleella aquatilis]
MDTHSNLQQQIDETLNVLDNISEVNVSPFFKDKTMNVLFAEKEEDAPTVWAWFTPKLQLVTLFCLVILNVIALTRLESTSDYDENLAEFAESYGLLTSDEGNSILNN